MTGEYEPIDSPDETTIFPYHELIPPDIGEIYHARRRLRDHLQRTPLVRSEPLSAEFDADVYLKREDTLPTGAFKVRGGLNLVAQLEQSFSDPGLIAASTGNHGQSVAYAGRLFDVPVTVVVPDDANPSKVRAMERFGAAVLSNGRDFDDARQHAEALAAKEGYRYIHSANEPDLIAGVGTAGLELLEDLPEIDYVFCPIGGGSSAAGYCLTAGALGDATIIGAQSERAPAMYRAWDEGQVAASDQMETFAEGIATRVPFALTVEILRDRLDDFRLVSEQALRQGVRDLFTQDALVAEGASAASLAAMRQIDDELEGHTVAFPISGRNIEPERFMAILGGVS